MPKNEQGEVTSSQPRLMPFEMAKQEVVNWMDYKRVPDKLRDKWEEPINILADAVQNGQLSLDPDTHEWTQTLVFPVNSTQKLVYKPRLTEHDKRPFKASKAEPFTITLMALTGASIGVIEGLDLTTDKTIADYIALFFP